MSVVCGKLEDIKDMPVDKVRVMRVSGAFFTGCMDVSLEALYVCG